MKTISSLSLAFLIIVVFGVQTASAQFPIKVPKITKPNPKPSPTESAQPAPTGDAQPATQPQPDTRSTTTQAMAGTPEINWLRLQFMAETINEYKKDYDTWSWLPRIKFRTTAPLPSGAHYYVEVSQPGGAPWVKFDCEIDDHRANYQCGYQNEPKDQSILTVGIVPFTIKMRNELAGTEATLFTGKAKVEKAPSDEVGPAAVKRLVYYVNQDWNMPFGQVYIDSEYQRLHVRFWVRDQGIRLEPHVFYQGNEVGRLFYQGMRIAAPSCSDDIDYSPSRFISKTVAQGAKWQRIDCTIGSVLAVPDKSSGPLPQAFDLSANNGEYEIKVLRNNKLARSIKFTVENGKIKDNGIYAANKMGSAASNFIIVPLAILDDQDGPWDRNAWKTDAFYGHPLTGFSWP